MHNRSCLCGAVRYEIASELGPIVLCHCSKCRKASGSAFNAVSPVARRDFRLQSGADAIAKYESATRRKGRNLAVAGSHERQKVLQIRDKEGRRDPDNSIDTAAGDLRDVT